MFDLCYAHSHDQPYTCRQVKVMSGLCVNIRYHYLIGCNMKTLTSRYPICFCFPGESSRFGESS